MKGIKFFICGLCVVLMASCATMPLSMSGSTIVDDRLKSSVFSMLPAYAKETSECKGNIEFIATEIIKTPKQFKFNAEYQLTKGDVVEKWTLTMCGKKEIIYITFKPDGNGSTDISYSRKFENK